MRTKTGLITSAKMQNTVTVTVHRYVMHPTYGKRYRKSKKFLADTNGMELSIGDMVQITECRPISKRKCFKVTELLKKAVQVETTFTDDDVEGATSKRDHRDAEYVKEKKAVSSPAA
ncbi:MAG: 30S ribosomal protein S17 [Candidatus Peribacteraceae bacterium]